MKNILILGGVGFIGLALTKQLVEKSFFIYNVDNLQRGELDNEAKEIFSKKNVKFINADLSNQDVFSKLLKLKIDFDEIYFFASFVGVKYTKDMPDQVLFNNTKIIINVLTIQFVRKLRKNIF